MQWAVPCLATGQDPAGPCRAVPCRSTCWAWAAIHFTSLLVTGFESGLIFYKLEPDLDTLWFHSKPSPFATLHSLSSGAHGLGHISDPSPVALGWIWLSFLGLWSVFTPYSCLDA